MRHTRYQTEAARQDGVNDDHRLITEANVQAIYTRIQNLAQGGGLLEVTVRAWWQGELHWARNRVTLASDQRDIVIRISRKNGKNDGSVEVNQTDEVSLAAALRAAERIMNRASGFGTKFHGTRSPNPPLPYPETTIWSDATYRVTPEQRAQLAQTLAQGAEDQQMLSAGTIRMHVFEQQEFGYGVANGTQDLMLSGESPQGRGASRTARDVGYRCHSEAQCSMTVRHPKGLGSGWAGLSSYDWSAIDSQTLAKRALDKCLASLNPVAIEPGRYTVILEPQAVNSFASFLRRALRRRMHEERRAPGVFSLDVDPTLGMRMTKLGLQIIDERISMRSDPMDQRLGVLPDLGLGPVTWIEHGVLKSMDYDRNGYALSRLRENLPSLGGAAFMMTGGTTSMDEMIETTKRGLIVTRFSGVEDVFGAGLNMLCTGLTRDGLWLVENGKITKAVKNMRFTDSPLFVFNQVEQLGVPVPVFAPGMSSLAPGIVPSVKSRDFAFTATVDAI